MKKIGIFILSFLICLLSVKATTSTEKVAFVRCVDGDTAIFKVNDEEVKFRFLAIDTPETVHPTKEVEEYGKDASEYTCNKLTNAQEIIVEYENSNKTDKYGRKLAWIWVDESLLQKELVSIGYAEVAYIYGKYRYTDSLCLIQKEALNSSLGLWADKKEEGFCSTVDLTGINDIIFFDQIDIVEEEKTENVEIGSAIIENVNKIEEKISSFADENEEIINKVYLYVFIGAAIIYIILKDVKKK